MTTIPVLGVRLVREGNAPAPLTIREPRDAARILRDFLGDRDRETFAVLLLSARHQVLGIHIAHVGQLNSAEVHPREVFKAAVLANAYAVIVAHNHPSGDLTPSEADFTVTKRLRAAADVLGIELLDHIIVGPGGYVSLRESSKLDFSRRDDRRCWSV